MALVGVFALGCIILGLLLWLRSEQNKVLKSKTEILASQTEELKKQKGEARELQHGDHG